MKTATLNRFKKSDEVIAKEKAFAKKVKATFIIIPSLCLIAYVIINVISAKPF